MAADITGRVYDLASKKPLPGATVIIKGTTTGAVADENGRYVIKNVDAGTYILEVSSVGFVHTSREVRVSRAGSINADFSLQESVSELDAVVVRGEYTSKEIEQEPVTIKSIDARALGDLSLGAEELLKQTTGVVVRQDGGLGGNVNINLNGLTGNAVRIFYDGIPLEVYGGGLQINNIPVDALERMDVYKGVMPVDIGTDALGGGINLVPKKLDKKFLNTSYTIGSFNTHRFTLDGGANLGDKTYLSLLSYVNYSDNDFTMRDIRSSFERVNSNGFLVTDEEVIDARRFHNRHFSTFVELGAKITDLSWADEFKIATSFSYRDDEIQNGQFLRPTSIGEATRQIENFTQRVDYKKTFFNKLNLRYFGVLSNTENTSNDSTTNIYNWKGEVLTRASNPAGAELFIQPTARVANTLGTAHRLVLNYLVSDNLSIKISDFFRYSEIDGNDPLGVRINIGNESIDPNTIPSTLTRNILGSEVEYTLFDEKVRLIGLFKNYFYDAEAIDVLQEPVGETIPVRKVDKNFNGFGFGFKYQIISSTYIRSSFERAARIPTEGEIFGDFAAIVPNFQLKPETSDNLNLGIGFEKAILGFQYFLFQVDAFVRDQTDLIRAEPFGPENSRFVNEDEVEGRGIEVALSMRPIKNLSFNGNFTYQSNKITTPRLNGATLEEPQVPNIPLLFFNVGTTYDLEDLFDKNIDLQIFGNYFFTNRYSISEVSDLDTANPDFVIPEQHLVNLGLVVKPGIEDLRCSFSVKNVLDELMYDNFRIPRPGINYSFKINYSIL